MVISNYETRVQQQGLQLLSLQVQLKSVSLCADQHTCVPYISGKMTTLLF